MLQQVSELVVEKYLKKEAALGLKSDSFVVKSNVHFPTDYSLLYDCSRVVMCQIIKLIKK